METAYAASLPPRERRLAGRLEGFGDIVFGFAVSQCALQLPMVGGHADLGNVASLTAYFGTFAILAVFWLSFHSMMSSTFRPTRIDLILAFSYLALVTLMPYALHWALHRQASLESARSAVAQYSAVFSLLQIIAVAIMVRNMHRGWATLDEGERAFLWRGLLRRFIIGSLVLIALVVDLEAGPVQSSAVFASLLVIPIAARLLLRTPPVWLMRVIAGTSA